MGKRISLGTKLVGGFVAVSLVACLVGLVGYRGMRAGSRGQDEIATAILPSVHGLWMVSKGMADLRRSELIVVTPGVEPDEFAKQKKSMDGYLESIRNGSSIYEPIPREREEDGAWKEFKAAFAGWQREHDSVVSRMEQGDREGAFRVAYGSARAPFKLANEKLGILIERNLKHAQETDATFDREIRRDILFMTLLVGGSLVLSLTLGIVLATAISRSLNRAIDGLKEGAEQVSGAAMQLSSSSQGLAEGSSEQAASLEETAAAMEELSAMTKRNSESAGEAKGLTDRAAFSVGRANDSMTQLVDRMAEISSTSEEIGKIIKTIDEIAFQTNLLALNAAVEAARAGEAGAGFAVVADEVRNLAQRAAGAAKNTSDLIEGTIRQIQGGTQLVGKTEADFREVTAMVGKVTELVSEVAAASSEQMRGIEEVGGAVSQMDQVTQRNAANAESVASAAEEMTAQTASVREIVGELQVLVRGEAASTEMSRRAPARKPSSPAPPAARPGRLSAPKGAVRSIASKRAGKGAVDPESVFPMDDGADLSAF